MTQLKLTGISKTFPGVRALDRVDLTILPGEIHALCGENGAGKSTLMNILVGNLQPDEGTIILNNAPVIFSKPQQAIEFRIAIVYQQLSLIDSLNVAENIFANQQPVNVWGLIGFNELYKKATSLLRQLDLDEINPRTLVSKLSPAQKQMVEIAKALSKKPSILILDEPTASLTEKETKTLFNILQNLKGQGTSIIYISHRLEEIFLLADRISILKDGKHQGTFLKQDITKDELIKRMVGREIKALKVEGHSRDEILLSVKNITGKRFHNVTFELRRGEILGLSGLVGAGRTEIARAVFGVDSIDSGEIILRGKTLKIKHSSDAISHGMAYVPEERKRLGLFSEMSIQDNIIAGKLSNAVSGRFYSSTKARTLAENSKTKLNIAAPGVHQRVVNLSGGNQQKVVLAKWLLTNPEVLIVDEPTHGIDVGAKFEIYEILNLLAEQGKGIIMISSDLPELLGICDRIVVIKMGEVKGELSRRDATEEKIMAMVSN